MRNMVVAVLLVGTLANAVKASPLADLLIGVSMLGVGGFYEAARSEASNKREENEKKSSDLFIKVIEADESYYYYSGAAEWERLNFGNTALYNSLLTTALTYKTLRTSYSSQATPFSNDANDYRKKENIYKGVSLTSFAVGGAFIVKATVCYFMERSNPKQADSQKMRWVKNIELRPTQAMDGARLGYQITF